MKYPDTKIELAAGKSDVRAYLNAPYLDVDNAKLVATDGHILAVLPVELDDGDTSGPVPIEAMKVARQRVNLRDENGAKTDPCIKCNTAAEVNSGASFPQGDMETKYPDYERVMAKRPQVDPDITFDAKLLINLVDALSDRGEGSIVSLWFAKDPDGSINPNAGIRVEVAEHPDRIGTLMTCRY